MEQNRSHVTNLLAHVEPVTLAKAGSKVSVPIVYQVNIQQAQVTAHVISARRTRHKILRKKHPVHLTAQVLDVDHAPMAPAPPPDVKKSKIAQQVNIQARQIRHVFLSQTDMNALASLTLHKSSIQILPNAR